ncbi:MAG: fibrobacter succinogenes major paralogous domain-containing protein [bacterium]
MIVLPLVELAEGQTMVFQFDVLKINFKIKYIKMKNYLLLIIILFAFNSCTVENDNINVIGCKNCTGSEIKICNQIWMTKNLDVLLYKNGDTIRHAQTQSEWQDANTKQQGAWCYYDNDYNNSCKYGKLYNWFAVNDTRGIAPAGWHIPTVAEWIELFNCLGGADVACGKLKEAGIENWANPNNGATNESGFTALPGGYRYFDGVFHNFGGYGYFWTSSENNATTAFSNHLYFDRISILSTISFKGDGQSVRCVKD